MTNEEYKILSNAIEAMKENIERSFDKQLDLLKSLREPELINESNRQIYNDKANS